MPSEDSDQTGDQSLRWPPEEALSPWLPTERTSKTQVRLGGYTGCSEPSLGAQVILLVSHVAAHMYATHQMHQHILDQSPDSLPLL